MTRPVAHVYTNNVCTLVLWKSSEWICWLNPGGISLPISLFYSTSFLQEMAADPCWVKIVLMCVCVSFCCSVFHTSLLIYHTTKVVFWCLFGMVHVCLGCKQLQHLMEIAFNYMHSPPDNRASAIEIKSQIVGIQHDVHCCKEQLNVIRPDKISHLLDVRLIFPTAVISDLSRKQKWFRKAR